MSRPPTKTNKNRASQQGLTFVLILVALLGIGGLLLFAGMSTTAIQRATQQSDLRQDALNTTQQALLGHLLRATDGSTGNRLGVFPTPDIVNATGSAIQYDGLMDTSRCLAATSGGLPAVPISNVRVPNVRCLGKLPWRDLGLDLNAVEDNDPLGQIPWMAISANLTRWDQCLAKLNSDLANWPLDTGSSCPAPADTVPYPWLTVVDQNGSVVSNRVALVLIMPGAPIQTGSRTQSRTPANPGGPRDYLDAISLPVGCVSSCAGVFDNAGLTNVFVQIPRNAKIPATAEDTAKIGQSLPFNDELVFLTVDDVVKLLEERVTTEMANAVRKFRNDTASYPWAAPFSTPNDTNVFTSSPQRMVGLFPFFVDAVKPTPTGGFPKFSTDLEWAITGLSKPTKRDCKLVQKSPEQWINTLQNITKTVGETGTLAAAATTCTWKGMDELACDGVTQPAVLTQVFKVYDDKTDCDGNKTGTNAPFGITRTIAVSIDANCDKVTNVFSPATNIDVQRRTWSCPIVQKGGTFNVTVQDVFATTPSVAGTHTFSAIGEKAVVSNMRYQPLMPYWFYENDWYKTAFYALPRAAAPGVGTDCGVATALTLGSRTISTPIVQLAGRNLTGNARPSGLLTDYLESANATGVTDCKFEDSGRSLTSSYNDQTRVVMP